MAFPHVAAPLLSVQATAAAILDSCCCLYHDAAAQPSGQLVHRGTGALLDLSQADRATSIVWQGQPEDYA